MKKFLIGLVVLLVFTSVMWPFLFGFGLVAGLMAMADTREEVDTQTQFIYERGNKSSSNKILSVKVFGPILDRRQGPFGPFDELLSDGITYGYETKDMLMAATTEADIKAVVIEINSPGGTVTGSQAIADGIAYYQETTGKPVLAFGSGLVASGGYWVAATADRVYADAGSLVGSIGVIGGMFPVYNGVTELGSGALGPNVVTRDGIELITITAGEGKDFGNPFRQPTEKELSIARQGTDEVYGVFVNHVSNRRKLSVEQVTNQIGAYVYSEGQAQNLGLVDELANRDGVYAQLAQQLGLVQGDYQVVTDDTGDSFLNSVFGVLHRMSPFQASQNSNTTCGVHQRVMAWYGDISKICHLL